MFYHLCHTDALVGFRADFNDDYHGVNDINASSYLIFRFLVSDCTERNRACGGRVCGVGGICVGVPVPVPVRVRVCVRAYAICLI